MWMSCVRCIGLLAGTALLAACSGQPTRAPSPVVDYGAPAPDRPRSSGQAADEPDSPPAPATQPTAIVALLDHAERQANDGKLDAAAATLERALRIDPRNPVLWHHMATVRLAQAEAAQAEQLAMKSNSLAPGNYALQARNWQLIAQARRVRGDQPGAIAADRQARKLEAP